MKKQATLRRTNIGHSKSLEALMVHITWTSSKVVHIEARQAFMLQAATVKVLHDEYTVLAEAPVNVQAGQVLYFVQSDGFPNWYYVLTYTEARFAFTCSCPKNFHFHKQCEHQQHALAFVGQRYARRVAVEHAIMPDWQQHVEDDVRQATLERQYENLVSSPQVVESPVEMRNAA